MRSTEIFVEKTLVVGDKGAAHRNICRKMVVIGKIKVGDFSQFTDVQKPSRREEMSVENQAKNNTSPVWDEILRHVY